MGEDTLGQNTNAVTLIASLLKNLISMTVIQKSTYFDSKFIFLLHSYKFGRGTIKGGMYCANISREHQPTLKINLNIDNSKICAITLTTKQAIMDMTHALLTSMSRFTTDASFLATLWV